MMVKVGKSILMCCALCALLVFSAFAEIVQQFPCDQSIIEAEAFCGSGLGGRIEFPEGLMEIHSKAFANCSITEVVFHESIQYIAADAFLGCTNMNVIAPEGSYAYKWAVSRGFIEVPEEVPVNQYADEEQMIAHQLGIDEDLEDKQPGEYVSGHEFMLMLDHFIAFVAPEKLEAWRQELTRVRAYNGILTRGEALLSIEYATDFVGGYYREWNGAFFSEDTGDLGWWDNHVVDEELFGDIMHQSSTVYDDWNVDRYASSYVTLSERMSRLYMEPLFDLTDNSFHLERPLTKEAANAAIARILFDDTRNIEKASEILDTPNDAAIAQLRQQKDEAVMKIYAAESEYEVGEGGTVYYVSPGGNDENDGLSPETAWQSLNKVNSGAVVGEFMYDNPMFPEYYWAVEHPDLVVHLSPGDVVLFQRGGVWRGVLRGSPGVTYSAYGIGDKPRILCSPENGGDGDKWSLVEGTQNIWVYYQDTLDYGGILLDNTIVAQKRMVCWTGEKFVCSDSLNGNPQMILTQEQYDQLPVLNFSMMENLEFINASTEWDELGCAAKGKLYLRCDEGNPGEVFSSIEFFGGNTNAWLSSGAELRDGCTLDNFEILYSASSGVSCADYTTVRNCVFGWGGGGTNDASYSVDESGYHFCFVRAGDGIMSNDDYNTICNNYVYEYWDGGIAMESASDPDNDWNGDYDPVKMDEQVHHTGNVIRNNVVERCCGGIFMVDWPAIGYHLSSPGFTDNLIDGNMVFDANISSWAHRENDDQREKAKSSGASLFFGAPPGGTANNIITNNILCGSLDNTPLMLLYYINGVQEGFSFNGNTFAQKSLGSVLEVDYMDWNGGNNGMNRVRNYGKLYQSGAFLSDEDVMAHLHHIEEVQSLLH